MESGHPEMVSSLPTFFYKVTLVVVHLVWVDLHLGCSTILLGQEVATMAAKQPGELPIGPYLSQPNQGARPPVSPCRRKLAEN